VVKARLRALRRRAACLWRPRTLVLVYHHVREPGLSAPWLTVTPERFTEQMTFLHEAGLLIGLDGLLAQLRHGRAPRGGRVLVTFDDAAADTYTTAWPILRRLGIPATVFVPTGLLGRGAYWWNRLYRLREDARAGGLNLSRFLADAGVDEPPGGWRGDDLWRPLRHLADRRREELLAAAAGWVGTPMNAAVAGAMSAEQLAEMGRGGLITLGAHTVSHPVLAGLDPTRVAFEVAGQGRPWPATRHFAPSSPTPMATGRPWTGRPCGPSTRPASKRPSRRPGARSPGLRPPCYWADIAWMTSAWAIFLA
jgi:peptidoglycan/xylan/chitin deacetylase (PgdA/CDA1 family)